MLIAQKLMQLLLIGFIQGLEKLLTHDQMTEWRNLYAATDRYTDGWLTAGKVCLIFHSVSIMYCNRKT